MVPGQAQSGWKAVIGYVCSLDDTSISFLFFSAELRVESWAYAHWANTEPHLQPISWSFVQFLQSMHGGVLPALRLTPQTLVGCWRVETPVWKKVLATLFCEEGWLKWERWRLPSHTAESCSQAGALSGAFTKVFWLLAESVVTHDVEVQRVRRTVPSQVGRKRVSFPDLFPSWTLFFFYFEGVYALL